MTYDPETLRYDQDTERVRAARHADLARRVEESQRRKHWTEQPSLWARFVEAVRWCAGEEGDRFCSEQPGVYREDER